MIEIDRWVRPCHQGKKHLLKRVADQEMSAWLENEVATQPEICPLERKAAVHKFVLTFTLLGICAWASDADCGEPLFACETANRKVIWLCAVEEETGRRWSRVQYRFGPIDKPEFVYPADSSKGPSSLFFSHFSRKGVYEVNVRFRNAGYEYLLASVADARGDGLAEVTVSKGGRRLSTIACIERPWIAPIALQRTLA